MYNIIYTKEEDNVIITQHRFFRNLPVFYWLWEVLLLNVKLERQVDS